jgi:hypothetical protein
VLGLSVYLDVVMKRKMLSSARNVTPADITDSAILALKRQFFSVPKHPVVEVKLHASVRSVWSSPPSSCYLAGSGCGGEEESSANASY